MLIVERIAKQKLQDRFWLIYVNDDNTASVISVLHSGIQMSYSERQCADVSKFSIPFIFCFFYAKFIA